MLHNLDPHTLAFVSALSALAMAIVMIGIYLAGTRERAIAYWSLAGLFFALGHLIGHTTLAPGAGPPDVLELAWINGTLTLGHGFVLLGVQHHLRRRVWHLTVLAMAAVVVLAIWFWPMMQDHPIVRLAAISLMFVALSLSAAGFLWTAESRPLKNYHQAVAAILVVYSLFLLLRVAWLLLGQGPDWPGADDGVLIVVFLSAMLFYLGLAVSLSLMLIRRKEVHLQFLARHDALTGLLNRYSMDEHAARELARSRRSGQPFSLVSLDLDHFKVINDTHGHVTGDQVLEAVAERIRSVIREGDIAFRMGGEEFLVMLPDADMEVAKGVADRLQEALNQAPVGCRDTIIPVSASFGVAMFNPATDEWEALLRRADRALYRAKDLGRNRVELETVAS